MVEVLLIVRINTHVGLHGIQNFHLLKDAFTYRLARGLPFKEGIPYPLQYKVRIPLSGLENLPTRISNPEACVIITNPLRMRTRESTHRRRPWELQLQAESTPRSIVSSSCSIHPFGYSDMTGLVLATGRLLTLYMWNRQPLMCGSDLEMVTYTTRHIAKALPQGPHLQIIETYWNTALEQNNIWSISFEPPTKKILNKDC
jgi:hypothetical protein